MYLSVNGIVTFERSYVLRETVAKIPIERLLLETDCPYLAPVPLRGKRNEPSFVRYVAQTVAQIKKLSFEEIAQATTRNAQELFGL
jgi:TatD DNase family protein